MLGETVKWAPWQRRDYPGSHADVAGCGGETARDIPGVGCGKLIDQESEGVSECFVLVLEERVSL